MAKKGLEDSAFEKFLAGANVAKIPPPEELRKRIEKENAELKANSKPLHQLIVTEQFTIEDVITASYATSIAPMSEMVLDGPSRCYYGGHTSEVTLTVKPHNAQIPVTTLAFKGYSTVRAGETIEAKIPCYEIKEASTLFMPNRRDEPEKLYFPRKLTEKEHAIELKLLSPDGKTLRTERAVDYNFFKEK